MWRAMPPTPLSIEVHNTLMKAYTALTLGAELQRLGDRRTAQEQALKEYQNIDRVAEQLQHYIDSTYRLARLGDVVRLYLICDASCGEPSAGGRSCRQTFLGLKATNHSLEVLCAESQVVILPSRSGASR